MTLLPAVSNQQGDNKKMEDAKSYLTLPCTKTEMEEKEAPSGKNLHSLANFTPTKDSTKDSFQIATVICSTKLTQNGRACAGALNYRGHFLQAAFCVWPESFSFHFAAHVSVAAPSDQAARPSSQNVCAAPRNPFTQIFDPDCQCSCGNVTCQYSVCVLSEFEVFEVNCLLSSACSESSS